MEQIPPRQGGEQTALEAVVPPHLRMDLEPTHRPALSPTERLTDEQLIHQHITQALSEGRLIDHATARAIAAGLHNGQASALYALASSGALVDGVESELAQCRTDSELGIGTAESWLDAMEDYLSHRTDRNPIDGWAALWPTQPQAQASEEQARADLMDRITAASVTTLGQVATIVEPANRSRHSGAWSSCGQALQRAVRRKRLAVRVAVRTKKESPHPLGIQDSC